MRDGVAEKVGGSFEVRCIWDWRNLFGSCGRLLGVGEVLRHCERKWEMMNFGLGKLKHKCYCLEFEKKIEFLEIEI